jgi:cell division initiation protein
MIDLTPLEVRKKKGDFRRGMRGYDPQSVDDFLDLVADRLEQVVREHAAMRDRLARVEDQVNDYRERERALTEALVSAQEMREQMRQQLEREAQLKRREAEADAESIRSEAAQTREREEEGIRILRARQTQFVQSYRAFLERELAELAVMMESLHIRPSSPPPAQRRTRAPDEKKAPTRAPAAKSEPADEADPMALPFLDPGPSAAPLAAAAGLNDNADGPFLPDPEPDAVRSAPSTSRNDKSFDELLNDLPAFAGTAEVKQEKAPPAAPDQDNDASLLADVRAQFDAVAADDDASLPTPEAMPDADEVLELVDDVADDEDEDGWMSTLLEGKGDDRSK